MKTTNRHFLALPLVVAIGIALGCSKSDFALPDQTQAFATTATYNNKVDILIMSDNSSSMLQYQNKFANEVPSMINSLNALGMDYHIAVVTTDMRSAGNGGKFLGTPKFLSSTSSNLVSSLQARIANGQAGSDLERGLESLMKSLQPSYLQNDGAGFFRDDALLSMIILTNENDYSDQPVSVYQNFFNALKPPFKSGAKSWIMNFVGVISIDGQCNTTADFKEAGLRYMELAKYTGGVEVSVCDSSLSTAISNVRSRIVEILTEYKLDRKPKVETIVVKKNGIQIPEDPKNGWTYFSESNSIRFFGTAQPSATDAVNVDYTPSEAT